jgi:hypothetical protein
VLRTIEGDPVSLIVQAIYNAVASAGLIEMFRAGHKPISDTSVAIDARLEAIKRDGFNGRPWIVLLTIGLAGTTAACAGRSLARSVDAVHAVVAVSQDSADFVCDANLAPRDACQQFNARLVPVIDAAERFARAAAQNSPAELPAMVLALGDLRTEAIALFTDEQLRRSVLLRIDTALKQLGAKGGQ